ncbi:MAG: LTA synthase family protein [Solobacterium sp.]|nr:LTA synthase family protein [Solobacterium sp.]
MRKSSDSKRRFRIFAFLAFLYIFPGSAFCGFEPALLISLGTVFAAGTSLKEKELRTAMRVFLSLMLLTVTAFLFAWISQGILGLDLFALGRKKAILEILIILAAELVLWLFTNSPKKSAGLAALLISIMTTADYFVYTFRGSEMSFIDFMSVNTALTVSYNYTYTLTEEIVFAFGILMLFLAALSSLPSLSGRRKFAERLTPVPVLAMAVMTIGTSTADLNAEYFELEGSENNGYLVNYLLQVKETVVREPEDYSLQTVGTVAEELHEETENDTEKHPDIIIIMDESFADMSCIGDGITTNQEVTPFISSLKENTIKGYALSSVYGGGTPNSEYEVLTGNTMMFLSKGIMAYQQYISQPSSSMVSVLNNMGYRTIAMHPFNSSGWNRTEVYPLLGFDEMYFLDDFPQEDMIRFFVSDQEMFETVVKKYRENIETEDNVFIFGVTIQNHGGYEFIPEEYQGPEQRYQKTISIEGNTDGQFDDAEQYLSLAHETDQAVQWLLEELEKEERDIVVLFYGDHYPGLSENFYDTVLGRDFESLDDYQKKYTVPFFIWTNYDQEEQTIDLTSFNYLSSYVYEAAGIELPDYNKFLKTVEEQVPAMNTNGYWSESEGRFLEYKEAAGSEYDILHLYNILEYNNVCDISNTNRTLFPVTDTTDE